MKRLVLLLLPLALSLNSCGSSSSSTTSSAVSVSIFPSSATVAVNGTVQFSASVANASSTLADYEVNGVKGGNSTTGTIDSNGLYTAPAAIPSGGTVGVTAVSQSNPSVSSTSSTVTITAAAVTSIAPAAIALPAGTSQAFTLNVTGGANNAATWQVNGVTGGSTALGLITQQGVYTAPRVPPPGGTVTLKATLTAQPTVFATAVVTVTFSDATIQGNYAFSMSGQEINGFFLRAGSFVADGQGHLSSGIEDFNEPAGVSPKVTFTGSYSIGPDGRGTMTFLDGSTPSAFRIVVASASKAHLIEFDSFATANGELDAQDTSSFTDLGMSGTYIFDFDGLSSALNSTSIVGEFSANGSEGITGGEADINDGGVLSSQVAVTPATSSYQIAADGRGTMTLALANGTTLKFSLYMVSAGRAKLMELDVVPVVLGDALLQQAGVAWDNSALNSDLVFLIAGSTPSGEIADAGRFTANGSGGLVSGSGVLDENFAASTITQGAVFGTASDTYSIDATGRGTMTLNPKAGNNTVTLTFVFYMISPNNAVIQETDSSIVSDGSLLPQSGGPFSAASFGASYAFGWSGVNGAGQEEDFVGQSTLDGAGKVKSGLVDINNFGSLIPAESISGTYTMTSNGRGTLVINPATDNRNFVIYMVSPTQVFVLGVDTTRLTVGSASMQF